MFVVKFPAFAAPREAWRKRQRSGHPVCVIVFRELGELCVKWYVTLWC
jgi:hypothetical protein